MIPVSEHLTEWPKGRRGLHWLKVKRTQSIIQGKAWMLGLHIRWGGTCSRACCILMYQEASWVGSRAFLYNFNQAPMALLLTARTLSKGFIPPKKYHQLGTRCLKEHFIFESLASQWRFYREKSISDKYIQLIHISPLIVPSFPKHCRRQCCHFHFNKQMHHKPHWCVDRHGHRQNSRQLSQQTI